MPRSNQSPFESLSRLEALRPVVVKLVTDYLEQRRPIHDALLACAEGELKSDATTAVRLLSAGAMIRSSGFPDLLSFAAKARGERVVNPHDERELAFHVAWDLLDAAIEDDHDRVAETLRLAEAHDVLARLDELAERPFMILLSRWAGAARIVFAGRLKAELTSHETSVEAFRDWVGSRAGLDPNSAAELGRWSGAIAGWPVWNADQWDTAHSATLRTDALPEVLQVSPGMVAARHEAGAEQFTPDRLEQILHLFRSEEQKAFVRCLWGAKNVSFEEVHRVVWKSDLQKKGIGKLKGLAGRVRKKLGDLAPGLGTLFSILERSNGKKLKTFALEMTLTVPKKLTG